MEKMSVQEMLRRGFQELNEQTEGEIKEQMKSTKDENELKKLQRKLDDVKKLKGESNQNQQEETQAEAMARRMEQIKKNEEHSKNIKRFVIDGKTGQLVEVTKNIETNGHKKRK